MKPLEFDFQINRLKQVFGNNHYTEERNKVLFGMVEDCDIKPFESQVSKWIVDLKTAPIGEHFRAFAIRFHTNQMITAKVVDSMPEPSCKECWDRGWVFFKMREELLVHAEPLNYPIECSAICNCEKGRAARVFFENSTDHKDVARRTVKPVHHQWYLAQRWSRPTYTGKTWAEFFNSRDLT